jgi:hypothetical protein
MLNAEEHRRLIGNDIAVIIYVEEGASFSPQFLLELGTVQQVYVVVRPEKNKLWRYVKEEGEEGRRRREEGGGRGRGGRRQGGGRGGRLGRRKGEETVTFTNPLSYCSFSNINIKEVNPVPPEKQVDLATLKRYVLMKGW